MGCPSSCVLGDNLVFSICTHDPDTGELTDADSIPTYRIYEDETESPILTGSMAKLDDGNTTGFYTELIAASVGNGFEAGKTYTIYIQATVDAATGGIALGFKVTRAETGNGARTITVTVNDGTDPLESAKVRFTSGSESYVGTTNASGQVVFYLDDATWTVVITKSGYTFTSTTLTVSANASQTYSMTAISVPASDPGQTNGVIYCYDENGDVESGVVIYCQTSSVGSLSALALDEAVRSGTSDANGLVTFAGLFKGASYKFWRGQGNPVTVAVASDADDPLDLSALLGRD